AVTRAPFTASIIIFEMTDKHSIIFFLLLGSLIASMIASRVEKSSFYDILKENYIVAVEKKHEAKLIDAT
ncbi:MAG TPA: chloride channel protein, partial [Saprospiraceae bacterium]|nr:chloride channel protein [Saprospiraceae bacterium]